MAYEMEPWGSSPKAPKPRHTSSGEDDVGIVPGRERFVYPGLLQLLAYALHPQHTHSRQWVNALLTRINRQGRTPVHRCQVCGGLAPRCRCWERC
jgi:hypothetical protein